MELSSHTTPAIRLCTFHDKERVLQAREDNYFTSVKAGNSLNASIEVKQNLVL